MIEQFVKDLLAKKSLPGNLKPEVYDRLVNDLVTRVNDLINKRLLETMDDQQLKQLDELTTTQPDNIVAVQKFIEENVPNKQAAVTGALAEFSQLYLGNS
jgi:hypothetical protein